MYNGLAWSLNKTTWKLLAIICGAKIVRRILVNSIAELLQSKEGFLAPLLTTFPWSLKCTTVLCSPCNFQVILMSCFSHISLMGMFSRSRLLFAVFWWSSGPVKFLKSLLEQGRQHQVRVSYFSKKKINPYLPNLTELWNTAQEPAYIYESLDLLFSL